MPLFVMNKGIFNNTVISKYQLIHGFRNSYLCLNQQSCLSSSNILNTVLTGSP
ncbi:hypothetical protein HNP25_003233 [Arcicella rosea]|uniref:Uncharacterized protein n=1 Tax=Arcicella rosea TaxID=502909 RepID=A0A841EK62_9BACT|nr:hypothetical protein [Arcicella rosea]